MLERINLILSWEPPQPPLGRLGTINLTVVPEDAGTVCCVKSRRKTIATTKSKKNFLDTMSSSLIRILFE